MVYQSDRSSQPQFKPSRSDKLGDNDFLPWTVTPPTVTGNDLQVPYTHFALIGLDTNGNVRTHSSRSLRKSHRVLFTPDFRDNFVRAAGAKGDENAFAGEPYPSQQSGQQEIDLFSPLASRKRCQGPQYQPLDTMEFHRQPQETESDFACDKTKDRVPIEIGNEEKIVAYYKTSFMALQQLSCRHIAKSYIKAIEPRKQVKHPYNGGRGGPGEKGDPEKTKPDWWPPGVIHREPDHLRKPDRLQLLIHIFRNLSKSHGITADKLEEAGQDAHRKIEQADRRELLDEIYRVRRVEESYDRGEIDANTVIYVTNREPASKTAEREESVSDFGGPAVSPTGNGEHDAEHDAEHDIDASEVAQTISTEPEQVRSATQTNMGLSEPPSPEQQQQQQKQQYQSRPQPQQHFPFLEDSRPPLFSTSDYEIKNKPSAQSPFCYLPQTGFVPPVEQPAMVGPWNAYQQQQQQQQQPPMFLPVDYETGPTGQVMGPNIIQPTSQQHSMQPASGSLVSENSVPNGLPDLSTARSQAAQFDFMSAAMQPSFRTGSLSHPHCVPVQEEPMVAQSTPRYKRLRYQ